MSETNPRTADEKAVAAEHAAILAAMPEGSEKEELAAAFRQVEAMLAVSPSNRRQSAARPLILGHIFYPDGC